MPDIDEERQRGLSRGHLVEAALVLVDEEGLDGLSMRALADRLDVKAASLYWHVRDRRELLELLAESILETVRPARERQDWRATILDAGAALRERVARQKDADQILLEVPEALGRSATYAQLKRQLTTAGLGVVEADELASLVMVQVITAHPPVDRPATKAGSVASIAVDSGSRGVLLRAGSEMQGLVREVHGRASAAPAIVRGERVVVRRLRGVGAGEIELNPGHPWRFQIQGPTWNTTLQAAGIDVREIKLDGGAAKVECFLPLPIGIVPILVSGGVVGVKLHRPPGVAVAADVSTGAVRLKLEDLSVKVTVTDLQWESEEGASVAPDRYQLRVSGGAVQVDLDTYTPTYDAMGAHPLMEKQPAGEPASALDILLDGVESRVRSRASTRA